MNTDQSTLQTWPKEKPKSNPIWVVAGILVAGLILFGFWFVVIRNKNVQIISPLAKDKPSANKAPAKDVMNPLTGVLYTSDEAAKWVGIRPLGVMVNNHVSARMQSGLTDADVVYEIVAEGGITRFLAFFLTTDPAKVGPIRSTREYYLTIVKEMGDAMIMHIGWSPQALEAIETWPVRSLARVGINCEEVLPDPKDVTCWRNKARVDGGVAWEHTAFGNAAMIRQAGIAAGWDGKKDTFRSWSFKDDTKKYAALPDSSYVTINFWDKGDYSAAFTYKPDTNTYLRFMGFDDQGKFIKHVDEDTKKQIEVKNLIVQFAEETSIQDDPKHRLDYKLIGSGEALVFIDGKVISATWNKADRDGRTIFYDNNGQEVEFNRGNFWISIVPSRNTSQVVYK